jgi:hypothetical protein
MQRKRIIQLIAVVLMSSALLTEPKDAAAQEPGGVCDSFCWLNCDDSSGQQSACRDFGGSDCNLGMCGSSGSTRCSGMSIVYCFGRAT